MVITIGTTIAAVVASESDPITVAMLGCIPIIILLDSDCNRTALMPTDGRRQGIGQ